jgi:hypothetical protein
VFTVLPHFALRYRQMRPEVARDALLASHGGLSLEWCAVICNLCVPKTCRTHQPAGWCPCHHATRCS